MSTDTGPLPMPSAIGWVSGYVKECDNETRRGIFLMADGQELPCQVMYTKPDELMKEEPVQCTVYPNTVSSGQLVLKICGPVKTRRDEEQFRIVGQIKRVKDGVIAVNVWSERKRKNFQLSVNGFIQAEKGEYWRLFAVIDEGKMILLDGEKLADSYTPIDLRQPPVTVFESRTNAVAIR